MGEVKLRGITCSSCGHSLNPEWAHRPARPACPECGAINATLAIDIASIMDISSDLVIGLSPHETVRDWRQRWVEIEAELVKIDCDHSPPLTAEAINSANQRLFSFFIQAYHLKDALIRDPGSRMLKHEVEGAVSSTPALALLADLANLDKHYELDVSKYPPRSGSAPTPGHAWGQMQALGAGWRLISEITHRSCMRDGVEIACEAVAAWRAHLKNWHLI